METNYSRLFYAGISYGEYPEAGSRLAKTGLPIRKLRREFPYLLGQDRRAVGKMQIYHALLPEHRGKTFWAQKPKPWKKETAERLLKEAGERALNRWDCREQIFASQLWDKAGEVPQELLAVCLYRCRPFDRLCISLDEEKGVCGISQALEILLPWLPKLRQVIYFGEESEAVLNLEDFLYGEFGIIMMKAECVPEGLPWLDLREEKSQTDTLPRQLSGHGREPDVEGSTGRAGREVNCCVSPLEAIKFLDTAVKNGYNTKVN